MCINYYYPSKISEEFAFCIVIHKFVSNIKLRNCDLFMALFFQSGIGCSNDCIVESKGVVVPLTLRY